MNQESFLQYVNKHEMNILQDHGVYRHIRFKKPESNTYWFDLITWPGNLCINGDMGTFVFNRDNDMFKFFRMSENNDGITITPDYWSEKLIGIDRDGYKEFDEDAFIRVVSEYRINWVRTSNLSKEERRQLWDAVTHDILDLLKESPEDALRAAYEFSYNIGGKKFVFCDLYDHNFSKHNNSFIWCCYAIVWGISIYDKNHTNDLFDMSIPI